jgi:DegV family protein with EDD domain
VSAAAPLLITDSSCDLPPELARRLGVEMLHLRFRLGEDEHVDDLGATMSHERFYALMREGATPTTAAVPLAEYVEAFESAIAQHRPALLLGLSSALSSTYETALTARDMVVADHPGADIRVLDSLNASAALGFLLLEATRVVERGAGIDTLTEWASTARTRVNGYFTLESLEHLRRGGRISDALAFAGAMLDVRPVLRIDGTGQLVFAGQARGRRKSMKALVDVAAQRASDPEGRSAFVAHGDALEDAYRLKDLLLERVPFAEVIVAEIGPVIGSHVGPGMLAVVFSGAER